MDYASLLSVVANWAAILTAVVAFWAYGQFVLSKVQRRRRLEKYLYGVRNDGKGQKSVLHLMRQLRLTEEEVMEAAFHSKIVEPAVKPAKDGLAQTLLFSYKALSG